MFFDITKSMLDIDNLKDPNEYSRVEKSILTMLIDKYIAIKRLQELIQKDSLTAGETDEMKILLETLDEESLSPYDFVTGRTPFISAINRPLELALFS